MFAPHFLRIALPSIAALLVVACGGGGESPGPDAPAVAQGTPRPVYVFRADLTGRIPNLGRWYNYIQSAQACASGIGFPDNVISPASCFNWVTDPIGANNQWVHSTGPWWIDPNHKMLPGGNGFGYVNVIAFTQLPAALLSPANLDDTTLSFSAHLGNTYSTVTAPSRLGTRKSHVYFWFQTRAKPIDNCTINPQIGEDCTRQSDYILTGADDPAYQIDSIPLATETPFRFRLSANDAALWTCLGAGINVKYECEDFATALRNVAVIGFLAAPVLPCPTIGTGAQEKCDTQAIAADPARYFNQGTFSFRALSIEKNTIRNTELRPAQLQVLGNTAEGPDAGWSPLLFGESLGTGQGAGIRIEFIDTSVFARLGLTTDTTAATFETLGYQILAQPNAMTPGDGAGTIMVVRPGHAGDFNRFTGVADLSRGDTVDLYRDKQNLVFLKNDEVVFQVPDPCGNDTACQLYPFASHFGTQQTANRFFQY